MLPGGSLRHRGSSNISDNMVRLNSVMTDSARRFRGLPFLGKLAFMLSLIISLTLYGFIFHYFLRNDVKADKFLENEFCPACLGHSGCELIYYDQVQLSGMSGYRFNHLFNAKNIHHATIGDQNIVLKKLGSDAEIQELDKKICKEANRPEGCDVARVLFKTDTSIELRKEPLQPKHLKQSAGMFTCASYRLLDRLWNHYKEKRKQDAIMLGDQMQVWYTANLNPEPLLLQTFPASERWPFPHYYGACGRHVLVEHVGRTLEEYKNEAFEKRAGIAYELLKIADLFTNNNEDFALYMTDLNWENFGVDAAGKVRILDAENIIIVDKLAVQAKKPKRYDDFLQSRHNLCKDSQCLAFNPDDLCTRLHTDHNYYAVCSNLLDPQMTDPLMPGGLLHDMPEVAKDFWDLEHLLNECTHPSKLKGRILAKDKLMTALANLRDQSTNHEKSPDMEIYHGRNLPKKDDQEEQFDLVPQKEGGFRAVPKKSPDADKQVEEDSQAIADDVDELKKDAVHLA